MKCAWNALLGILPRWLDALIDPVYRDTLQELRLRRNMQPEILFSGGQAFLPGAVTQQDLDYVINGASRYSPWAAQSVSKGYLTAAGGHRIGLCGEGIVKDGRMSGLKNVTSMCIRVARDYPKIGKPIAKLGGSVLILGSPGSGKTTLLRDVLRELSRRHQVAVVDERGELFPTEADFDRGRSLDVLTGCDKASGIEMLLRTMGPEIIGVDEITAATDCEALLYAGWCGVRLIATAHAESVQDLLDRPVYRPLVASRLFDQIVVLGRDKSWHLERMDNGCCTELARC